MSAHHSMVFTRVIAAAMFSITSRVVDVTPRRAGFSLLAPTPLPLTSAVWMQSAGIAIRESQGMACASVRPFVSPEGRSLRTQKNRSPAPGNRAQLSSCCLEV
jgi:hypothetical protein